VKTPDQVVDDLRRRVSANWHTDLSSVTATWPHAFFLGAATKTDLTANFGSYQRQVFHWRDWAAANGLELRFASRLVSGTVQSLPTHVIVADLDTAVGLLGVEWARRIPRGRTRLNVLAARFPQVADPGKVLRAVDGYTDTDFDLLCRAADWFRNHTASGLTPRQVPIEGLHAKWLNTHKPQLQVLAGVGDVGLLPRHPQRVHFTYLDPDHLAAGGRKHDSATVGDSMEPAYPPQVVVITENKDTAIHFPHLAGAITVEGDGCGAEAASTFAWLTTCPHLIYWGDMDADGFEIVDQYRRAGVPASTILMDLETFGTYERFGSTTDAHGVKLTMSARRNLPTLTASERALYENLTDPGWARVLRIEQERIPLTAAVAAVRDWVTADPLT
jgi:hypothetical protein